MKNLMVIHHQIIDKPHISHKRFPKRYGYRRRCRRRNKSYRRRDAQGNNAHAQASSTEQEKRYEEVYDNSLNIDYNDESGESNIGEMDLINFRNN